MLCYKNSNQLPVLNRLVDIFAVSKFDYSVMERYQNLTRKPELFWAPLDPGPGMMYPLNPPLAGAGYSPHRHVECGKQHVFSTFKTDFCTVIENSLPPLAISLVGKDLFFFLFILIRTQKSLQFEVKTFHFALQLSLNTKFASISGEDLFSFLLFNLVWTQNSLQFQVKTFS